MRSLLWASLLTGFLAGGYAGLGETAPAHPLAAASDVPREAGEPAGAGARVSSERFSGTVTHLAAFEHAIEVPESGMLVLTVRLDWVALPGDAQVRATLLDGSGEIVALAQGTSPLVLKLGASGPDAWSLGVWLSEPGRPVPIRGLVELHAS